MKLKSVEKEPICDKCKKHISGETTTAVLPNGHTRKFHAHCLPPEDMKVLGKRSDPRLFPV